MEDLTLARARELARRYVELIKRDMNEDAEEVLTELIKLLTNED